MAISKALLKYGYCNFSLTVLEYCDCNDLLSREKYYFDLLLSEYNPPPLKGGFAISPPHLLRKILYFVDSPWRGGENYGKFYLILFTRKKKYKNSYI